MIHGQRRLIVLLILLFLTSSLGSVAAASPLDTLLQTVAAPTLPAQSGGGIGQVLEMILETILGPILHLGDSKPSTPANPATGIGGNSAPTGTGSLQGKVIVIDPGHGGSNPGAMGNNIREADNNLAVALKLKNLLLQNGAQVVMTRESDRTVAPEGSTLTEELAARLEIANTNHADLFVSIHTNENSDSTVNGLTTFYHSDGSLRLASAIQTEAIKSTGATDKGTATANYYVLRNSTMPAVLVEMGFLSNQAEAAKMGSDSYRSQIAKGIMAGIKDYFTN